MTPRLLLLTGSAAGEVAAVFRDECAWSVPEVGVNFWGEVRDYWEALAVLQPGPTRGIASSSHLNLARRMLDNRLRSLPGGEEWLVGLVLPAAHMTEPLNLTCGHSNVGKSFTLDCSTCRNYRNLPARLAILAPEPPPLLVERVRAWGGEMWHCGTDILSEQMWEDCPEFQPCIIVGNTSFTEHTWPEAVRAALGEAE